MMDEERVRQTIVSHSDEELLRMLSGPGDQYSAEALEIARAELARRGGRESVVRHIAEEDSRRERALRAAAMAPLSTADRVATLIGAFLLLVAALAVGFGGPWLAKASRMGLTSTVFIIAAVGLAAKGLTMLRTALRGGPRG
jgi:hypothetical protein